MTGDKANDLKPDVRRRQVFYIPGYDPMLPRRYRELYRTEGAKQAKISGYSLDLKGQTGSEVYTWSVKSEIKGMKTEAEFAFLLWSDIVQGSMDRSIPATFLLLARVVWIYLSTGALWRLTRLRRGPVIAALYPVFMLSAQLLLACLAGWLVGWLISLVLPIWLGLLAGLLAIGALMRWFRSIDNRFFAYYLLHDYAFSAQYYGAEPPEMLARMAAFGDQIHAALAGDFDEVLLVGHSSGAHIGVSVLADMLRRYDLPANGPKLGFLTLGQVVPMVSFLPRADRLRGDLAMLSQSDALTWVDITAPGDGCTFALCDPVAVSGAAPAAGKRWPLVISAAFTQTLSPELYRRLKWRFFRMHFQYLCAFDRPGDFDYFQITAGPVSLASRYQDRTQSPSRILSAHSPYQTQRIGD
ncbi:MAG: hypothetical protein KDA67_11005 [Rhodobacteraceae bacterium]|nr:hypothetical protein [Paracoccaceae bacterium]